jgi:hypothetical protein
MTVQLRFRREAEDDVIERSPGTVNAALDLGKNFFVHLIPTSPRFRDFPKAIRSCTGTSDERSFVGFPIASFMCTKEM